MKITNIEIEDNYRDEPFQDSSINTEENITKLAISENLENQQESEKRQKKYNKIFSIANLLIVLGAIAFTGYYYGYIKNYTNYCNNPVRRFGVLQCISDYTKEQNKNQKISFKFTRNGVFNPVQTVQAINNQGECTNKHSLTPPLDIEKYNIKEICQWEYTYEKQGGILHEKAYDKNSNIIYWLEYSPHKKNAQNAQAYFINEEGQPLSLYYSDAEIINYQYSDTGYETSISFFDSKGKKQLKDHDSSYHKVTKKYDEKGNQLENAYFDINNQPTFSKYSWYYNREKYHKRNTKYDKNGNLIEVAYFGVNNEAIFLEDSDERKYHKFIKSYDEKSNTVDTSFYGRNNNPLFIKDSEGRQYHKLTASYDEAGNIIVASYFGLNNKAILLKDSEREKYHTWTATYNKDGEIIEASFFGLNNQPILVTEFDGKQYHKWTANYDEQHKSNKLEQAYFGLHDEAILIKDSDGDQYHKWTAHYNKYGESIEEFYFGINNDPVESLNLNSKAVYLYKDKQYEQAEKIFTEALIKSPNNLTLLFNDMELALVQNNMARFQQRFKIISSLLIVRKRDYERDVILDFLSYLANPQQNYRTIIQAIKRLPPNTDIHWDFSDIRPAIKRQNKKTRDIAWLFIDYFYESIDFMHLKAGLLARQRE